MWKKIVIVGLMLFSMGSSAHAQEGSLSSCQSIKDRIDYYQSLRRKGGTAQQMETWKKYKKREQKKFSRMNCKKWRSKLQ